MKLDENLKMMLQKIFSKNSRSSTFLNLTGLLNFLWVSVFCSYIPSSLSEKVTAWRLLNCTKRHTSAGDLFEGTWMLTQSHMLNSVYSICLESSKILLNHPKNSSKVVLNRIYVLTIELGMLNFNIAQFSGQLHIVCSLNHFCG